MNKVKVELDDLPQALRHVELRTLSKLRMNEFNRLQSTSFEVTKRVPPTPMVGIGHVTVVEVRYGTDYTMWEGAPDEAHVTLQRDALTRLTIGLYQDVLDDLLVIIKSVGDGRQYDALTLLHEMFTKFSGRS
jgi:hypothetical protein